MSRLPFARALTRLAVPSPALIFAKQALAAALLLACTGCHLLRSPAAPMPFSCHPAPAAAPHTLIVMLPGIASRPEDFERNGFVARVRAADPRIDVIAADAHFGYYSSEMLVERLHEDVIGPRAAAYERVWLLGISLGGLGVATYARAHSDVVDRALMIAPYLGTAAAYEPVIAAGGLRRWQPEAAMQQAAGDELTAELRSYLAAWRWCRTRALRPDEGTRLYLGYGLDDGFRVPNGALAAALPEERCFTCAGGHVWPVWAQLFDRMLENALADAR